MGVVIWENFLQNLQFFFGEVQVGGNNGGDTLNARRDEFGEVVVMMSTQQNILEKFLQKYVPKLMLLVVGVQMKNKGPEKRNQMNPSRKRRSDYIKKNRRQTIHQISASENTPHDDHKKLISFIHPMNWTLKQETGIKPEKNFESITDQIKKRKNVVKGRKNV